MFCGFKSSIKRRHEGSNHGCCGRWMHSFFLWTYFRRMIGLPSDHTQTHWESFCSSLLCCIGILLSLWLCFRSSSTLISCLGTTSSFIYIWSIASCSIGLPQQRHITIIVSNTINKNIATSTDYKGSIIIKKKKKSQRTSAISVKKKKYYLVNRKETKCQVNIYVINCNQIKEKHLYIRLLVAVLEFTHSYVSMSCQRCTNFACNNICDKLLQFYRTSLIKPTTHHSLARC